MDSTIEGAHGRGAGPGLWAAAFCFALLAACVGSSSFRMGEKMMSAGDFDAAVRSYEAAAAAEPTNVEYRVRLIQAREAAAFHHEKEGEACLVRDDPECAIRSFQRALDFDPSYKLAEKRLHDAREKRRSAIESGPDSSEPDQDRSQIADPSSGR